MKKTYLTVAVICTLCMSLSFSSCIGSFSLTNKLLSWNKQIGDKFVNELVFFAFWLLPVYEVSAVADIFVLNSIEFWSGENPVAAGSKIIEGNDGKYLVKSDKNGYTIESLNDGSVVRLDYNKADNSWGYTLPSGETHKIFAYVDDTHVALPTSDGSETIVEISQAGLYAYQTELISSHLALR